MLGRKKFPIPQQLGRECSGVVEAVGKYVTNFKVGDRVHGLVHPENSMCENAIRGLGNLSTNIDYPAHVMFGAYAQYVVRPENYWMHLPDNVNFDDAAAGGWAYPTSLRIIKDRCNVQVGDVVCIAGASGGMGIAAVQWAKLMGAEVVGLSRGTSKLEELKTIGCDYAVDCLDEEEAPKKIREITATRGVEHFIDFTGASSMIKLGVGVLREGGCICTVADNKENLPFSTAEIINLEMKIVGVRGATVNDHRIYLQELNRGRIHPVIASIMKLSEIQEAYKMVEEHRVFGKIIIHPQD